MRKYKNFAQAYITSIDDILADGTDIETVNDKSSITFGKGSKEIIGYTFEVSDIKTRLITIPERKVNLINSIGFFLWILRGSNNLKEISYYNPIADKLSDDGISHRGAYGFRLGLFNEQEPHTITRNQVEDAIQRLNIDNNSRRTFLSIYDPSEDSKPEPTKDYPCTIGYHLLIRNGCLDMICMMRSQSVVMVMPYDIFNNTMLQEYIATRLNIPVGKYIHFASSYHILDSELEFASTITNASGIPQNIQTQPMPSMLVEGLKVKEAWEWVIHKEMMIREAAMEDKYTAISEETKHKYGKYMADIITLFQLHAIKKVQPDNDNCRDLLIENLHTVYKRNL